MIAVHAQPYHLSVRTDAPAVQHVVGLLLRGWLPVRGHENGLHRLGSHARRRDRSTDWHCCLSRVSQGVLHVIAPCVQRTFYINGPTDGGARSHQQPDTTCQVTPAA